ncbi:MAG TPA: ABC transporter ATP-binding protein [Vicinamibacterales bacterium]|nr:ABC transporter ATP-binding protein [Vicinamibacterales bacterium]
MLQVSDVWFGYDERRPALKGVTVAIRPDAVVGILGPNGSGKTTLLRVLTGTRRPQRGSVTLDGAPLSTTRRAALARKVAVVPQETQLAFDYTVAEVAMMGRYPHLAAFEVEGPADVAAVDEALASTGTLALKDRLFATLSGGEKQRVVIAAALAQIGSFRAKTDAADAESRFLLLDEPTASLDLAYQLEIGALLARLHAERRAGIVISTHDIGLAGTLCDTLVLLRDGAIVAAGPTDQVLTPDYLRAVYGVDTEITRHASGQRVVVAIRRSTAGPPP